MRRKPYTDRGITRAKCCKCGEPANQQWSACAIGNRWMPLCQPCDIGLNRVALEYVMGRRKAKPFLDKYEATS